MSFYTPYEPDHRGESLDVVVRAARLEDVERIAEIDAERSGDRTDRLTPLIARDLSQIATGAARRYTCVALAEDTVAAFAKCAHLIPDVGGTPADLPAGWYLTGVIVDRVLRRRGIGRRLTSHRIDWLRQRTDVVYYWVDEINRVSIDLHRDFGFEEMTRDLLISTRHNTNHQILFRKRLP